MKKNKPTVFGTVAGMTALIGMFPLLITFGLTQLAPWLGVLALTVLHIALMAIGVWVFVVWFGD